MANRTSVWRSFRDGVPYLPAGAGIVRMKVNEYFNVDAFTYPTIGSFSPVRRNAFVGPGYIQTDMNVGPARF